MIGSLHPVNYSNVSLDKILNMELTQSKQILYQSIITTGLVAWCTYIVEKMVQLISLGLIYIYHMFLLNLLIIQCPFQLGVNSA